jgi:hypothetical protein
MEGENMACETTNSNLKAGNQIDSSQIDSSLGMTTDVAAAGYCTDCGQCCCNCERCQKEKGAVNICAACARLRAAAKKAGG